MASHSFLVRAVQTPALLAVFGQRTAVQPWPCQALRHCVCQTEPVQLSRFGRHSSGAAQDTHEQSRDKDRADGGTLSRLILCVLWCRQDDRTVLAGRAWAPTTPCPGAGSAEGGQVLSQKQSRWEQGSMPPTAGRGCQRLWLPRGDQRLWLHHSLSTGAEVPQQDVPKAEEEASHCGP